MVIRRRVLAVIALFVASSVLAGVAVRAADDQAQGKAKKRKQAATASASAPKENEPDAPAATSSSDATESAKRSTAKFSAPDLARVVDRSVGERLAQGKTGPGPLADDAAFLRRACLDIAGVIPTAEKAAAFLDNADPEKRAKLIDELLDSPDYGRHLADIWQDLLLERDSTNRLLSVDPLVDWLADEFNANKPWDEMVRELLTATGTQEENGATTFFIANRTQDKLNDKVCQLFLGVSLQCAQCHNHPSTSWKRTEYWGMASFFSKLRAGGKKVGKGPPEVVNEGGKGRGLPLPDSAIDAPPTFLGGELAKLDPNQPYRPVLAQWLTATENPYFARAMVNRMWAHFFGRGLVNPVESIDNNAASHPELFDTLTQQFVASGFDLKHFVRAICNSETYQRTSAAAEVAASGEGESNADEMTYDRMSIKPLAAEQLYDSLTLILGTPDRDRARGRRAVAGKKGPTSGTRAEFVFFFQAAEGADPTEYAAGIPQVLRLMNSPQMNGGASLLKDLVESGRLPAENVERLYLTTLSRRPSRDETERVTNYLASHKHDPRAAYGDVLWALLNSSEFALNR